MVTPATTATSTVPWCGLRRWQKLNLKLKLLLCSPVLVPHIVGGAAPAAPGEATENVSVRHWEWVETGWVPAAAATPSRILIFFKKINNSLRENLCAQYGNSARITLLTTASWWRARRPQKSGSQVSSEKKVFRKKCFSLEKKNVRALLYLTYPQTARADRHRALPRSQTRGSLEVGAVLAGGVVAAGNDYVQ